MRYILTLILFSPFALYAQISINDLIIKHKKNNSGYIYVTNNNRPYTGFAVLYGDNVIIKKYTLKNGKLNGFTIDYYSDGRIRTKTMFKNNIKDGPYIEYNKAGDVILSKEYKKGRKVGFWESQWEIYVRDTLYNNTIYHPAVFDTTKLLVNCIINKNEENSQYISLKIKNNKTYYLNIDTVNWKVNELDTCIIISNICDSVKFGECYPADILLPLKIYAPSQVATINNIVISSKKPTYVLFHFFLYPNEYMYNTQNTQPQKSMNYLWGGLILPESPQNYYYFKKILN